MPDPSWFFFSHLSFQYSPLSSEGYVPGFLAGGFAGVVLVSTRVSSGGEGFSCEAVARLRASRSTHSFPSVLAWPLTHWKVGRSRSPFNLSLRSRTWRLFEDPVNTLAVMCLIVYCESDLISTLRSGARVVIRSKARPMAQSSA